MTERMRHGTMRHGSRIHLRLICTAALAAFSAAHGMAQAGITADKHVRLQLFGTGAFTNPNYNGDTKGKGGTLGVAAGFNIPLPHFEIFAETRATASYATESSQYVYSVGPRLAYNAGNFHPYGEVLYGYGKINFNHPYPDYYTYDNAAVWTYAGGVDYSVSRTWAIRAEVQQQEWTVNKALSIHPYQIGAGIRYQFLFHNRYGPE